MKSVSEDKVVYPSVLGHQPSHGQLIGVVVLASMEVRHAGEAVWQQFSTCHSLSQLAERMASLDEATFVGVVAFTVIFGLFIADGASAVRDRLARWLKRKK